MEIYRGIRKDGPASNNHGGVPGWWSPDRGYAAQYAEDEILAREFSEQEANLLDLRDAANEGGGWISGEALDAALPGLADLYGLDSDETVEASLLWDRAPDNEALAAALIAAGYDGLVQYEDQSEAIFLAQ